MGKEVFGSEQKKKKDIFVKSKKTNKWRVNYVTEPIIPPCFLCGHTGGFFLCYVVRVLVYLCISPASEPKRRKEEFKSHIEVSRRVDPVVRYFQKLHEFLCC